VLCDAIIALCGAVGKVSIPVRSYGPPVQVLRVKKGRHVKIDERGTPCSLVPHHIRGLDVPVPAGKAHVWKASQVLHGALGACLLLYFAPPACVMLVQCRVLLFGCYVMLGEGRTRRSGCVQT
jgi:hypothetical protein